MSLPRWLALLLILGSIAVFPVPARPAPAPSAEEITAAATWFDRLPWPDLRGCPYVEVTWRGGELPGSRRKDGPELRGFLLGEDDAGFILLEDGTAAPRSWPFVVQRFHKVRPGWKDSEMRASTRPVELADAVADVLARLLTPRDPDEKRSARFGRTVPERTAVFFLARCCERQGRVLLAAQLDAALPEADPGYHPARPWEVESFAAAVERDLAHVLMWKAVVDCGEADVSRAELVGEFERVARDFPGSEHRARAAAMAETLRTMVAEDEAHARTARPVGAMNPEEQVGEWIFRLRDQNGKQFSQPGSCDVFNDWFRRDRDAGDSPAHQLVRLGHAAVPALIGALDDRRPTRSVGYHRDFYFSHFVLTVGDCAEAVLARIAGRSFWTARTTSAAMEKDGQTTATRAAVESWWREVRERGEDATLAAGTRGGGPDSPEQASRLLARDPDGALAAITAGLGVAKAPWTRVQLVEVLAKLKTGEATGALRREMREGDGLAVRVAAARGLFRRGDPEAIPAMIAEWNRWRAPVQEDRMGEGSPGPLMSFLATCGEPGAMQALAEGFGRQPGWVRFQLLDVLNGFGAFWEPLRDPKQPAPPEIGETVERLLVAALEDRTAHRGSSGARHGVTYWDPRVCDLAAMDLKERWPERYPLRRTLTRVEGDVEVVRARNLWRAAHGLEALPLPEIPAHPDAAKRPNVIAALTWKNGDALPGLPLAVGENAGAESMLDAVMLLHRDLPADCVGFTFTAERPESGGGFVVTVEWERGPRPERAHPGWSYHVQIRRGEQSFYNASGGGSPEHRAEASGYDAERRALARVFDGDAQAPVVVLFHSRSSGN